jgi:hypothetical protein
MVLRLRILLLREQHQFWTRKCSANTRACGRYTRRTVVETSTLHVGVLGLWCYDSPLLHTTMFYVHGWNGWTDIDSSAKNQCKVMRLLRVLVAAEARFRFWSSMCGSWCGQNGTGTGFFSEVRLSPVTIIPPLRHTHSLDCHQTCNLSNLQSLKVKHLCFPVSHSVCLSVTFHLRTQTDPVPENAIQEGGQSPDAQ